MNENLDLIKKVEANLEALLGVYSRVHATLAVIDRQTLRSEQVSQLDSALDPPTSIDPAKAVAVLKMIRGSTSQDRFQLETFYSFPTATGLPLGSYIGEELKALGLSYHDLYPFLQAHGWVTTT
jgi:hypothetical protein